MIKGLELIDRALWNYGVKSIIKDKEMGDACRKRCFIETGDEEICTDTLYIVFANGADICRILQNKGNYLVFERQGIRLEGLDAYESNLILVPENADKITFMLDLDACFQAMERIRDYSMDLLDVASGKKTAAESIDVIGKIFRNPVTIYNIEEKSFPYHSIEDTEHDALWDRLVQGIVPIVEDEELDKMISSLETFSFGMTAPIMFDPEGYNYKRRLINGIWIDNVCRYQIIVLENRKFSEMDYVIAICISEFLADTVLRTGKGRVSVEEHIIHLVEDALDNKAEESELLRRAMDLGLTIGSDCSMVCVFQRDEKAAYIELMNLFHTLRANLTDCLVVIYKFKILILPNGKSSFASLMKKVKGIVEEDKERGWMLAVSRPYSDIADLRGAYQECRIVMDLRSRFEQRDGAYYYEDCLIEDFLIKCSKLLKTDNYQSEIAKNIVKYDLAHQTEYGKTLYCYLKSFKNKEWLASELCLHINTVRYRLDRCEELFGVDYDDYLQLFNILLSFELMHVME